MDRPGAQEELGTRRFFVRELGSDEELIALGDEAAKHARVLRLGVGDAIELFDGRGRSRAAHIAEFGRGRFSCRPVAPAVLHPREQVVVLVLCVPKGHKLDDIVRMTTELGVAEIRLAVSKRSISRPEAERVAGKLERLERIAIEAVRQSENAWLPKLGLPKPLAEVLAEAPENAAKLALTERSDAPFAQEIRASEVWVVVGPEGGLSDEDRAELSRRGFTPTGLGRAILRSETASVVGVSLALDRLRHPR